MVKGKLDHVRPHLTDLKLDENGDFDHKEFGGRKQRKSVESHNQGNEIDHMRKIVAESDLDVKEREFKKLYGEFTPQSMETALQRRPDESMENFQART